QSWRHAGPFSSAAFILRQPERPLLIKFRVSHTAVLLTAGFVALAVIVGATLWISQKAHQNTIDVSAIRDMRAAAIELRNGLLTAESSPRGYLFSANEIYLAPFEGANAEARRQAAKLAIDLARYPQFQPMAEQLGSLVEAKIAEMKQIVELRQNGR